MFTQEVNRKKAKMKLLNKLMRKINIAILSLSQACRKLLIKSPRMTTKKTMKKKVKMTMMMPTWRRPEDYKIKDELHKGTYQTNNSATITANPLKAYLHKHLNYLSQKRKLNCHQNKGDKVSS